MTPPSTPSYNVSSKVCSRKDCHLSGIEQPLERFHPNRAMKDGHKSECKDCSRLDKRKWEKKNPEKMAIIKEKKRVSPSARKTRQEYRCKNSDKAKQRSKEWAANNQDKVRIHSIKKRFRRQGTTQQWYEEQLRNQEYKCAICEEICPPISTVRLAIDHDHSCCGYTRACDKCRRGLLCGPCNTRLGIIEKTDWVAKAQAYLLKYHVACTEEISDPPEKVRLPRVPPTVSGAVATVESMPMGGAIPAQKAMPSK